MFFMFSCLVMSDHGFHMLTSFFYTETLFHRTSISTEKNVQIKRPQRKTLTHNMFSKQRNADTEQFFTERSVYTVKLSCREMFTERNFYTEHFFTLSTFFLKVQLHLLWFMFCAYFWKHISH